MAFYIADFGVHAISIADTATPVLCGFFFFFFFFFFYFVLCVPPSPIVASPSCNLIPRIVSCLEIRPYRCLCLVASQVPSVPSLGPAPASSVAGAVSSLSSSSSPSIPSSASSPLGALAMEGVPQLAMLACNDAHFLAHLCLSLGFQVSRDGWLRVMTCACLSYVELSCRVVLGVQL